ncbi:MAG: AAA family ATPase [Deltaproteobacteria bacterium]|nr:AAA family ATPase [Deltaproteobacteria bacterium]
MYTAFFGLKENPFNLTPDPKYLYLSLFHKEALDHLLYGINERKGFIVITGGIGTGKTTLCRVLLNSLETGTRSALIFNSYISDIELLKSINHEFGIEMSPDAESKKDYVDALNSFLLETFEHGENAVIIIDEAQNLSLKVLEQIRMLSNLETEREKLLQIVLLGQPELKEFLSAPSIRQLNERVMVRYDLKPLSYKDIRGYIEHRLIVAEARGNLRFANGAYKKIFSYSKGNPRRTNTICDRALLIAYTKEKYNISKGIAAKAVKDIQGAIKPENTPNGWAWKDLVSYTAMLVLLVIISGLAGWSLNKDIPVRVPVKEQTPSPEKMEIKKIQAVPFLDEQTSLTALFTLYHKSTKGKDIPSDRSRLTLVQFDMKKEYHVTLKRPFRVIKNDPEDNSSNFKYFVVEKITQEGAVIINSAGDSQPVARDFLLKYWGEKASWIYPHPDKEPVLRYGMVGKDVTMVQETLEKIGYIVEPTGIYDELTSREAMRFQEDFGLKADGISGPTTMALLYQMSG